jgi:hypothetical protein
LLSEDEPGCDDDENIAEGEEGICKTQIDLTQGV